jgi:Na+/H+ antiporter
MQNDAAPIPIALINVSTVLILLVIVTALAVMARRIAIPYPTLMVIAGLAIGFVPNLRHVELNPDIVFLLFLPPLLYAAAWYTTWHEFRAQMRAISHLAVWLVLATTAAIAAAAHYAFDMPWGPAFVLGAVISPTDAVAATAIAQRLYLPRQLVTLIEGESLVNDATGLIAWRVAVIAVTTGAFSLGQFAFALVVAAVLGVALGLLVGWAVIHIHRMVDDPLIETVVTILTPYATYLACEGIRLMDLGFQASGVLAVVTCGIYVGRRSPKLFSPNLRLQAIAVWDVLVFLLNGVAFIMIGLQLPKIADTVLSGRSPGQMLAAAATVCGVAIVVRIAWVYGAAGLAWMSPRLRRNEPVEWGNVAVVAWCGMRGVVSLAAALAVPLTAGGEKFPWRDEIIFLTFAVILTTLVFQSLTLPWLIRRMKVTTTGSDEELVRWARLESAYAALARLEVAAEDPHIPPEAVVFLRAHYEHRIRRDKWNDNAASVEFAIVPPTHTDELHRELIRTERHMLVKLRDDGAINDEVLRRIERDLDLQELRLKTT